MVYQIEGMTNGQWDWKNVSADRQRSGVLFPTREEAESAIPELAQCLDCPESDIRVICVASSFPESLAVLRERANLTVQELAEAAGLTRQAVHNYESGTRRPTWDAVQKLAAALGVPTDTFRDQ